MIYNKPMTIERLRGPELFRIRTVTKEQYTKTLEDLEKEGYTFVVAIDPVSIGQLATGEATSKHFDYLNPSRNVWDIRPPRMEVAINPNKLRVKKSNFKSTDAQIRKIRKEEASLRGKLPQVVRNFISMRMQNASVLVQLDFKYQEKTGEVLFTNWHGRTDDQTVSGSTANVGRSDSTSRLSVGAWVRGDGYGPLFAVSVVVLPRKFVV